MEERAHLLRKDRDVWWRSTDLRLVISFLSYIICTGLCILGFVMLFGFMRSGSQYEYLSIIRKSTNDYDLHGLTRNICLVDYFKKFPYGYPDIGYEYVKDLSMDPTYTSPIYTLELIRDKSFIPGIGDHHITIHYQNKIDGIKYDFENGRNVLVAWDYEKIPELAKLLGCKNCESWNINPISNITDESLFDVVWVIKREHHTPMFGSTIEYTKLITISLDLNDSDIRFTSPITENMSLREKLNNYECNSNSKYITKNW